MTLLVDINHETGDFSQWTLVTDTGSHLTCVAEAALNGTSYGMKALVDDTTNAYCRKNITASTTGIVRARFYFDPNSLSWTSDGAILLAEFHKTISPHTTFGEVRYIKSGENYSLQARIINDAGSVFLLSKVITDAPHYVEVYWKRSTSADSNDAQLVFWVDGVYVGAYTNIDCYDRLSQFASVELGTMTKPSGLSGSVYLDELKVNDDGSAISVPANVFVSHTGTYIEVDGKYVRVSHLGALIEVEGKSVSLSHLGAYVEIDVTPQKSLFISQAGIYVEVDPIETVVVSQAGIYVETIEAYSIPSSDVFDGVWTDQGGGTNLSVAVGEYLPDDSTYVHKSSPSVNDYFEVLLTDPFSVNSTGSLEIEWRAYNAGTGTITMKCELMDGSTVITSDERTLTTSPTTYTKTLTTNEYNSISNDSNLRFRFTVTGVS